MAITDPTSTIIAQLTDAGRQALARVALGEISFVFDSFAVGRGGFDPTIYIAPLPIDGSDTGLADQVYPVIVGTTTPISGTESPTLQTAVAVCRVPSADATYALGEIGLWGKIIHSNIPSEVGTIFMMALAHTPIQAKTDRHVYVYRFVIQF